MSLKERVKGFVGKVRPSFTSLPIPAKRLLGLGMTFALVVALPLFVWGITTQRFDIRQRAASGEPPPPTENPFTDVDTNSWSWKYIKRVTDLNLMSPRTPIKFSPAENITRAEMAEHLYFTYRYLRGSNTQMPQTPAAATPFTDISSLPTITQNYIAEIYQLGLTAGTSATTFSPAMFVDRAQTAVFLVKLYTLATKLNPPVVNTPFTDLNDPGTSYARDWVAKLYGLKITAGISNTLYGPSQLVTREQMATFISNTIDTINQPLVPSRPPTSTPTPTPIRTPVVSPTPTENPTSAPTSTPQSMLQLIFPNGGELLIAGVNYPIVWKSDGSFSGIDLQYVSKNNFYSSIAKDIPDTGTFMWQVNTLFPTEKEYKIRIYGHRDYYMTANDQSDNYFFVAKSEPLPSPAPGTPSPTPKKSCRLYLFGACWLRF